MLVKLREIKIMLGVAKDDYHYQMPPLTIMHMA